MLGFPVKDVKRGEMVLYEMKKCHNGTNYKISQN